MASAGAAVAGLHAGAGDSDAGSMTPSEQISDADDHSEPDSDYATDESEEDDGQGLGTIAWTGYNKKVPIIIFNSDVVLKKRTDLKTVGSKYHMTFKMGASDCKIIRAVLTGHGFHEVHPNSGDFNLMWTGSHLKPFTLRSMTEFQKINHFPRSYEITRKDRLYKNVQRMQQIKGTRHFDFVPHSFIMPNEYQDFCAAFLRDKAMWIVKPVASSRGRGVFLVNHPDQVPLDENVIVCKYILNPLLIDGFKFDVRLYVAVTSYDPIIIYLYEEGLTRFATVKYEKSLKHIRNQCMHLTNYSVNKKSKDYVSNDDADVEDYGNKWSLGAMLRYLKSQARDITALMMRIEDVIIKTIISAEPAIATACKMFQPFRGNCFELYGFDILIDANLKPWVLEVNLSPSLACDTPLDMKIKANMITDLLSLAGFICHDPMLRTLQQSRRNQDLAAKMPARVRSATVRSSSATNTKTKQRPQSAGSASSATTSASATPGSGNTDKKTAKSMAGLTSEEIKIIRRVNEEDFRSKGWVRIFPAPDSWDLYGSFLQFNTTHNQMLHQHLYPDKYDNAALSQSKVPSFIPPPSPLRSKYQRLYGQLSSTHLSKLEFEGQTYANALVRTRQYVRKLKEPSNRKKGRRKCNPQNKIARQGHIPLSQGVAEEAELDDMVSVGISELDVALDAPPQPALVAAPPIAAPPVKPQPLLPPPSPSPPAPISTVPPPTTALQPQPVRKEEVLFTAPDRQVLTSSSKISLHDSEMSKSKPALPSRLKPKTDILQLLTKGGSLSKIQARTAFAMYLTRVQQRLLSDAEDSTRQQPDVDTINEQMDLVLRFLKRAAVNLHQNFKVIVPSHKLSINTRRNILAKQLSDFVHIYSKETDQLMHGSHLHGDTTQYVNDDKFSVFINTASEAELEEVLTTYTKMHKSASIFLGTSSRDVHTNSSLAAEKSNIRRTVSANSIRTSERDEPLEKMTDETMVFSDVAATRDSASRQTDLFRMRSGSFSSGLNYTSPSAMNYANAVAIYSSKLVGQRPVHGSRPLSAASSSSSIRAGTRTLNRPLSASNINSSNKVGREKTFVDVYNEQAINEALQRLTLRQQARQYSPANSTISGVASEPGPSFPGQKGTEMDNDHNNMSRDGVYGSMPSSLNSATIAKTTTENKEAEIGASKPPSGANTKHSHVKAWSSDSHHKNLKTSSTLFNKYIDNSGVHHWNGEVMMHNQVNGFSNHSSHQYVNTGVVKTQRPSSASEECPTADFVKNQRPNNASQHCSTEDLRSRQRPSSASQQRPSADNVRNQRPSSASGQCTPADVVRNQMPSNAPQQRSIADFMKNRRPSSASSNQSSVSQHGTITSNRPDNQRSSRASSAKSKHQRSTSGQRKCDNSLQDRQQSMIQQSRALLEDSKAKHLAMIAQAHITSQNTVNSSTFPSSHSIYPMTASSDTVTHQIYAPRPPPHPPSADQRAAKQKHSRLAEASKRLEESVPVVVPASRLSYHSGSGWY